jgi:hypothetical protein
LECFKSFFQNEKSPKFYPEHRDKKLYGMLCCVSIPKQSLRDKIQALGLHLVSAKGEVFGLNNPRGFKAKDYQIHE